MPAPVFEGLPTPAEFLLEAPPTDVAKSSLLSLLYILGTVGECPSVHFSVSTDSQLLNVHLEGDTPRRKLTHRFVVGVDE